MKRKELLVMIFALAVVGCQSVSAVESSKTSEKQSSSSVEESSSTVESSKDESSSKEESSSVVESSSVEETTNESSSSIESYSESSSPEEFNGFENPLDIYVLEMSGIYGDSLYLKQGNVDILIDAGWDTDGAYVKSFVDSHCTDNILDLVVVTHPHGDHVGGMVTALGDRQVSMIIDYGTFATAPSTSENGLAAYENYKKTLISNGTIYHSAYECVNSDGQYKEFSFNDNFSVEVMNTGYYHENGIATTGDPNGHSVSLLFKYGEFTFLTQGDATTNTEGLLMKNEPNLGEVTMFKASHHGSSGSNSQKFLNKINPQMVAISASRALSNSNRTNTSVNPYATSGHPSAAAIQRIYAIPNIASNHNVYWNMYAGTMKFSTYGLNEAVDMQGAGPERLGYYKDVEGELTKVTGEENAKFSDTVVFKARGYEQYLNQTPSEDPDDPEDPEKEAKTEEEYKAMALSSHETYMSSENDTLLKVQGVVIATNGEDTAFIQNGVDGFNIYDEEIVPELTKGRVYTFVGYKKYHYGQREVTDIQYYSEDAENIEYLVNDVSSINISSDTITSPYHGSYVKLDKAIITKIPEIGVKAYSVYIKKGDYTMSIYVNPKNLSDDDFDTISDFFNNDVVVGNAINVQGIMSSFSYSGSPNPQIQLWSASELEKAPLSDDDQVAIALSQISLPNSIGVDTTDLSFAYTVAGTTATISYSSNNTEVVTNEGIVTHQASDVNVEIIATATLNDASVSKTFELLILGSGASGNLVYTETFTAANATGTGNYGQSGIKQGYADGIVWFTDDLHKWDLNTALHGGSKSDHYYTNDTDSTDTWCVRAKTINASADAAVITMFSIENLEYIEFYATGYGTYTGTTVHVSYSIDDGKTWVEADSFALTSSLDNYRAYIRQEGNVRIKFTFENAETSKATTSLDYIRFYQTSEE